MTINFRAPDIKELKPRPVVDANDPNKWFWDYIERRQREQVEEQMSKFN